MTVKTLKEMIKKHQVKQVFAIINDKNTFTRVFVSTDGKLTTFSNTWTKNDTKLYRTVEQISRSVYNEMYNTYIIDVKLARENADKVKEEINECRIKQMGIPEQPVPMELRPYYKVRADILTFQLRDMRV